MKQKALFLLRLFEDIEIRLSTLGDRKRTQKIAYLMKQAGLPIKYDFNWYVYGPYSPELTKDAFELQAYDEVPQLPALGECDKEKLRQLRQFLKDKIEDSDYLELLASLLFLEHDAYPASRGSGVIERLKSRKPRRFSDEDIRQAYRKLQESGLFGGD